MFMAYNACATVMKRSIGYYSNDTPTLRIHSVAEASQEGRTAQSGLKP